MAVISRPFSASARFHLANRRGVQTLSRLRPDLSSTNLHSARQGINAIRRGDQSVTGGFYTVTDELVRENP